MKEMMEKAGNSHLLTVLSYPNAGHLIEPPYTPHARFSKFMTVDTRQKGRQWQTEWFEVKMPKSKIQVQVLTDVSVSCCLCSDGSVGWRDGSTFSCSGGRLEEDADLSEGKSVRRYKPWCNFSFPPVTKLIMILLQFNLNTTITQRATRPANFRSFTRLQFTQLWFIFWFYNICFHIFIVCICWQPKTQQSSSSFSTVKTLEHIFCLTAVLVKTASIWNLHSWFLTSNIVNSVLK